MKTGASYVVTELFTMNPKEEKISSAVAGDVCYIVASIKDIQDVHVGRHHTHMDQPATDAITGYQPMKPMVYCGLYPIDSTKFDELRESLDKLKLNDASLFYEAETSKALGFGFRCGFLGLLHGNH